MNLPVGVGLRPATGRHLHLVSHGDFWITVCRKCGIPVRIKNAKYLVNDDLDTHIIAVRKAILIPALFVGVKRHFADVPSLPINFHLPDTVVLALGHVYTPDHLAAAALRAIALRSSGVRDAFRARAPAWPARTLFGFLRVVSSISISPVAILATCTAHPTTSAGRFCPCGPLGTVRAVPRRAVARSGSACLSLSAVQQTLKRPAVLRGAAQHL